MVVAVMLVFADSSRWKTEVAIPSQRKAGRARADGPQHAVEHLAVVAPLTPAPGAQQVRLKELPLRLCQLESWSVLSDNYIAMGRCSGSSSLSMKAGCAGRRPAQTGARFHRKESPMLTASDSP
ncbi:MAG: hypothetical protein JWM10_247, partial [Myxococcaceae bacterium]|nr:hypothetical protein [Myxococcaceae bacterium]